MFCGPLPGSPAPRPHLYVLDGNGNPVAEPNVLIWAAWFERANQERQLALDVEQVDGTEVRISTVFTGIDQAVMGAAVLWETMVFGGRLDHEQRRYTSREAALQGHAEMVVRAITRETRG